MKELKQWIRNESKAKWMVTLAAFVLTIFNTTCFVLYTEGIKQMVIGMIPGIGITLVLYYLVDGYHNFLTIMLWISKVAGVISDFLCCMMAWMLGLGSLIAIFLSIAISITVLFTGALLAYLLPVVGIWIFGFLPSWLGDQKEKKWARSRKSAAGKDEQMKEEVNWNRVYERVMEEVK